MSVTHVLLDLLVVLLAAKLGAEASERIGVPAVVGEILAGVIIGPSALHLASADDVLKVLGELGVILLLLDVGLEMDLGELAAVGRAALSVATIGVVVPFASGAGAAAVMGMGSKEAIFVGAALTATSVGITARVFGDLHALATVEARTVLGAAVADDVMGLVILTVVTRLVTEGSVSVNSVTMIVLVAVAFLVVASVVGIRIAPWLFRYINRYSKSSGTLVALSLVFTLGVAELANQAKLAPIVGAFVAGLALSRSNLAPRIRRELTPIGHLLIPVFFVQIGLDAQVSQFARLNVLRIAGVLLVIAVVGKVVAAAGMWRSPGDRVLVGLGMIPRGEVGLIFATLGLSLGIIGRDVYAALLLVVLATTLMTPSLLKWRVREQRRRSVERSELVEAMPEGGWLTTGSTALGHSVVDLAAQPPTGAALTIGLEAALAVAAGARPGEGLIDWFARLPDTSLTWDQTSRDRFDRLLQANEPHAWRFLFLTGLLDRGLPEVAETLRHRRDDPLEIDPTRALSWPRLERLGGAAAHDGPALRLAALVLDGADLTPQIDDAGDLAARVVRRLSLDAQDGALVTDLTRAASLLPSAARRLDGLDEEPALHLASYLGTSPLANDAFRLAMTAELTESERDRLVQLRELVLAALAHPELSGVASDAILRQRLAAATAVIPTASARIATTPSAFVLSQDPIDLARQAGLVDPPVPRRCVRTAVTPIEHGSWRLDVAVRDESGLLARQLAVLAEHGYEVVDLAVVVWPDKQSVSSFRLRGEDRPTGDALADEIASSIPTPIRPIAVPDAEITFDNTSSPWHTICTVRTGGGRSLLAAAKAFALVEVNVVGARSTLIDGAPTEIFSVVEKRGTPLSETTQTRIREILATGRTPSLRPRRVRSNEAH